MCLDLTCGLRVFVCSNMAFSGDFQPVLVKHSKSFSLVDAISVGVDRMQRNFESVRQQVETWRQTELSTVTAKMIIYQAFIESSRSRGTWRGECTTCTSRRNLPSSSRGRSGAFPMRSHRLSKISIPSRSFALRPNWGAFSIPVSSGASNDAA